MPAYYWIQLYKDPRELSPKNIINKVIDVLLNEKCIYRFSQIFRIVDDSLPIDDQEMVKEFVNLNLQEARKYAIKDIETWYTSQNANKWLPAITLIFEYDFKFDNEVIEQAKQIKLTFWLSDDQLFKQKVIVDLAPWEDHVLLGASKKAHDYNKGKILKFITSLCNVISPHFGWTDSEHNSSDFSYALLQDGKWPMANDFVIIGPQLVEKVTRYQPETSENFCCRLDNGGLILQRTYPNEIA